MSDDDESVAPSRAPSPVSALPLTARPYRFTWDPASRRPGPQSVSGTTEGRGGGDYFSAQPRLGLLNTSSSLTLTLPQEWSSAKHGFHAISTVLNNPHKRQAPPKAHSHLPTVVPADLPRVRRKDFDSYLRAIAPEWDKFEHNSQLGREGAAQLGPEESSNLALTGSKYVPPLDTVPDVFFHQKFNLGDPRTFNAVTEQQSFSSSYDPTALSHSLPLLEKFSHYADTVEQHLVLEISRRSTSFFAALTNLHDLRAESEHCLARVASLRKLLTDLDENSAKRGLTVVRRQAHADNLIKITEGVKVISGVVEMGRVARGLVGAGQWGEALGVIEEIERLWDGRGDEDVTLESTDRLTPLDEDIVVSGPTRSAPHTKIPPPPIPLSALHAYSSLPEQLRALTMEIAASLSSELVSVLRADLEERIQRARKYTNGTRVETMDIGLRDRLRPLLQGLVRTRGVKEGMLSWREVVLAVVRGVINLRLPTFNVDDEGRTANGVEENKTSSKGLSPYLKEMRHPEFMLLLQDLYSGLLNCVEGLQAQGRVIVDILEIETKARDARSTSTHSFSTTAIEDELQDLLSSAAELANTQAAKVISFRVEEHAALELADFLVLFNDSWGFVVRCEVLCRKMIVGLRGVVVSQAKVFLQAFHQARISRSAKLVEDEQWNPTEITPSLQHITDVIVDSAVRDAPELVIKSDADTLFSPLTPSNFNSAAHSSASTVTPNNTTPQAPPPPRPQNNGAGFGVVKEAGSKHLRIEERTYFAVSATAEVLVLLLDYLRVVVNLTMLTTDTMSRVIEFLKAFNSRTCQVVLGAGAMRSAGLKNITAKHLALASQSLSIMFELIPYVRETFRRHLSPKQAVMLVEFDKLKRDYQEHQNEIHSKLIAIMGDRLTVHIKTLQGIDWNMPKPDGGINDYMEQLVRESVTLHKVLSRYLSVPIVEYVMTQVFAAINHGLSEEYTKIELPNQEAKTRLLADAKYLHQKLSALKNMAAPSGMLVTVVSEKALPGSRQPSSPATSPVPVSTPTRASTLSVSANQRLKGLLSGKATSFEKALPTPMRSSSLAASSSLSPTLLPRSESPATSDLSTRNNNNTNGREEGNRRTSTSNTTTTSAASSSPLPMQTRKASAGFREVGLTPQGSPEPVERTATELAQTDSPEKTTNLEGPLNKPVRSPSPPLPPPPPPHDPPTPELPAPAPTGPESGGGPDLAAGDDGVRDLASKSGAIANSNSDTDTGGLGPSQSRAQDHSESERLTSQTPEPPPPVEQ